MLFSLLFLFSALKATGRVIESDLTDAAVLAKSSPCKFDATMTVNGHYVKLGMPGKGKTLSADRYFDEKRHDGVHRIRRSKAFEAGLLQFLSTSYDSPVNILLETGFSFGSLEHLYRNKFVPVTTFDEHFSQLKAFSHELSSAYKGYVKSDKKVSFLVGPAPSKNTEYWQWVWRFESGKCGYIEYHSKHVVGVEVTEVLKHPCCVPGQFSSSDVTEYCVDWNSVVMAYPECANNNCLPSTPGSQRCPWNPEAVTDESSSSKVCDSAESC